MKASVRRSQLITTYGVGALVAVGDESAMVLGVDFWPEEQGRDDTRRIEEPRLQPRGMSLQLPPGGASDNLFATRSRRDIPVTRFPRWYYCSNPSCRRLDLFSRLSVRGNREGKCRCDNSYPLVPSRFVAICPRGHIEDFPYWAWVHAGRNVQESSGSHRLQLLVDGSSGALSATKIWCMDCEIGRSMEGSFDRHALLGVKKCSGAMPWLGVESSPCDDALRVSQRGASNVWFPIVRSAISIPPWSEDVQRFVQQHWDTLSMSTNDETLRDIIKHLLSRSGRTHSEEEVLAAIRDRKGEDDDLERDDATIRAEEFAALCRGRKETPGAEFVAEREDPPEELRDQIELLTVVKRLKEVRVLTGFTRADPSMGEGRVASLGSKVNWLPAIPIFGEGVFLKLRESALEEWERSLPVAERSQQLQQRWSSSFFHSDNGPDVSPRFLLAHVLAHALINQWSLEGGYPAASLRERVYAGPNGTGLLIYTAAADSAGSLGGLIAQGESRRLASGVAEAVRRYAWCSSDPVCAETEAQGAEGLNLAACHCCALLPETSCEHRNTLLDRALLVGLPDDRGFGFFSSMLNE